MKSIVQNSTNISLHMVADETAIIMSDAQTTVGDPVEFHISDCNSSNCHVVENLTDPGDWMGHKYLVVDGAWQANPAWVDPTPSEETPSAE